MPLRVFGSLSEAKAGGFEPYDRAPTIYLVRRQKTAEEGGGWEMAAVQLMTLPDPNREPHG